MRGKEAGQGTDIIYTAGGSVDAIEIDRGSYECRVDRKQSQ